MPDTSNDWTEFENIDSGENGTIEGLMPLEGEASAFRYRKSLVVNVSLVGAGFGVSYKDLKGTWKVRVRADSSKNANGELAGAVLFEQEVEWTARVVIQNTGITLITWQPLGDGGSGKQKTSICAEEACAVVGDVNDAAQMSAYGETGAWRFLESPTVDPDATPRQKYDVEKGFSLFTDEGVALIGNDYQFYAVWQSAGYLLDIPEGAILETVFDRWQVGTIDNEALYLVSFKLGESGAQALSDAWSGQTWSFAKEKGALVCTRTRTHTFGTNVQVGAKVTAFRAHQIAHCLIVALESEGQIIVATSRDDGRTWTGDSVTNGLKFLDSVSDETGAELVVFGTATLASDGIANGDFVRVVLTRTQTGWGLKERNKIRAARSDAPLPSKPKGRFARQNTAIVWLFPSTDTTQIWRSLDNGLSFDLVSN